MNSTKHQLLYRLLEFKVLNPKRKKLISAHLLEGVSLARGCTMLGLNLSRESKRDDVKACLKAFRLAQDPDGKAKLWEIIRRVELLWDRGESPADPDFAEVNLPFEGVLLTVDGHAVDAKGNPAPAPQPPPETIVPAKTDWQCCGTVNRAGKYLCGRCGIDNPDTKANQARLWAAPR